MTLAPTKIASVTAAISALLGERASGIFQLTGPRDVSYADVGRFVAQKLGVESSLVQAASAHAAGLPIGATPLHTTLDSSVVRNRFGIDAADVWQVIESVTGSEIGKSRTMQNAG
jgi:dTDP-4-dehydrorhamnose reductase